MSSLLFVSAISRWSVLPLQQRHPGDPFVGGDPLPPELPAQPAVCGSGHGPGRLQVPPAPRERGLAAHQRRGRGPGGESAGRGRPAGAHRHRDLLQPGRRALPAVPDPRGPGACQAAAAGAALGGVAPALPGGPQRQPARCRGAAGGGWRRAGAAAGLAQEAGGEGEGADGRAEAEEEGDTHPAVAAGSTDHEQSQGTPSLATLFSSFWAPLSLSVHSCS